MKDDLALNLPISEIGKRLTLNARERTRLQTLLKVAVQAREDAEKFGRGQSVAPQNGRVSRFSRKGANS
jgi:hypothetical protein